MVLLLLLRYNIQSLLVEDSRSGGLDSRRGRGGHDEKQAEEKEEVQWVDHGCVDVPVGHPQDLALTWFSAQFEPTRRCVRACVRALLRERTALFRATKNRFVVRVASVSPPCSCA